MATGFGLKLVGTTTGAPPSIREYYVPSTDGTALYVGDVVELVNAMDPKNEVSVITRAATGDILLGVVVGFRPSTTELYTGHYRTASTNRYVLVCDDPDAVYEVQEDADGGSVSAANVGERLNIDIVVASGSTATGLSGTMSSVAATAEDLKIVGVKRNAEGNQAAQSGGAVLLVKIVAPAINATDSDS
jgi:hypothetical protein